MSDHLALANLRTLLRKEAAAEGMQSDPGEASFLAQLEQTSDVDDFLSDMDSGTPEGVEASPELTKIASEIVEAALGKLVQEVSEDQLIKLASEDPAAFSQVLAVAMQQDSDSEASTDALLEGADASDTMSEAAQTYLAWRSQNIGGIR